MKYFTLVVSALLLGAATAWAVPPEMGDEFLFFDGCPEQVPEFPLYDCGEGLIICEVAEIDYMWKVFFSGSGDPLRYWERQKLEGGLYELGNPDNFLPYIPLSLTYTYDFDEDISSYTGVWALINVPGYGQVLHDVGRLVADGGLFGPRVFEAGQHQYFDEDFEAVCDYMASQ